MQASTQGHMVGEPDATPTDPHRWARRLSIAGLLFGCLALALRYFFAGPQSLTYDEATYVELARHPWYSSYYPDVIFARHPPLSFLVLGAWTALVGESESMVRLPGLLFCVGAVLLVWDTVERRAGPAAAALTGVLLGLSFLWLVYGIQATMYPLAAFLAALAVHADARGRDGLTAAALTGFALTHLFGFAFLLLWIWKRGRRRTDLLRSSPAWLWLGLSIVAVVAARNEPGPGLGPAWQAARGFELFYDLTQDRAAALHHSFGFVLAVLLLNPVLLEQAWFGHQRKSAWGITLAILTAFLFTGPSFLRFAVPLQPIAFYLGFFRAEPEPHVARRAVLAIFVAFAALTSATAYVNSGLDAGVQNDVPGLVDWRQAATIALASNATRFVAPAPPPLAFYLEQDAGYRVTSSVQGPDVLPMRRADGRTLEVHLASDLESFRRADNGSAVLIVPDTQSGTLAGLFREGYVVCIAIKGAYVLAHEGRAC